MSSTTHPDLPVPPGAARTFLERLTRLLTAIGWSRLLG